MLNDHFFLHSGGILKNQPKMNMRHAHIFQSNHLRMRKIEEGATA